MLDELVAVGGEGVEGEGLVAGVDEFDGFFDVFDGDDGEDLV